MSRCPECGTALGDAQVWSVAEWRRFHAWMWVVLWGLAFAIPAAMAVYSVRNAPMGIVTSVVIFVLHMVGCSAGLCVDSIVRYRLRNSPARRHRVMSIAVAMLILIGYGVTITVFVSL